VSAVPHASSFVICTIDMFLVDLFLWCQICRDDYPQPVYTSLWILCEISIITSELTMVGTLFCSFTHPHLLLLYSSICMLAASYSRMRIFAFHVLAPEMPILTVSV